MPGSWFPNGQYFLAYNIYVLYILSYSTCSTVKCKIVFFNLVIETGRNQRKSAQQSVPWHTIMTAHLCAFGALSGQFTGIPFI
jgi:hypothetical protein